MVLAALADLVLPAECAGCGTPHVPLRRGACASCAAALRALRPGAHQPEDPPAGFPPCVATGVYAGPLRETLLAYKERGRISLAAPLGALLAETVAASVTPAGVRRREKAVLLIPVPSTARGARSRHGDHMRRLANTAARTLSQAGWPAVVAQPLRALPKPDSAHLDRAQRAIAAAAAFQPRPNRLARARLAASGRAVVVVDDIVTTGATLSALSELLAISGIRADAAAVLAATRLRHPS